MNDSPDILKRLAKFVRDFKAQPNSPAEEEGVVLRPPDPPHGIFRYGEHGRLWNWFEILTGTIGDIILRILGFEERLEPTPLPDNPTARTVLVLVHQIANILLCLLLSSLAFSIFLLGRHGFQMFYGGEEAVYWGIINWTDWVGLALSVILVIGIWCYGFTKFFWIEWTDLKEKNLRESHQIRLENHRLKTSQYQWLVASRELARFIQYTMCMTSGGGASLAYQQVDGHELFILLSRFLEDTLILPKEFQGITPEMVRSLRVQIKQRELSVERFEKQLQKERLLNAERLEEQNEITRLLRTVQEANRGLLRSNSSLRGASTRIRKSFQEKIDVLERRLTNLQKKHERNLKARKAYENQLAPTIERFMQALHNTLPLLNPPNLVSAETKKQFEVARQQLAGCIEIVNSFLTIAELPFQPIDCSPFDLQEVLGLAAANGSDDHTPTPTIFS